MFKEDFGVFTDPAGLGNTAIVNGADMYGIFERQFAEVRNVEGYYPTFLIDDVDSEEIEGATTITIDDIEYKSVSKQPDGTGMTLIVLEKV